MIPVSHVVETDTTAVRVNTKTTLTTTHRQETSPMSTVLEILTPQTALAAGVGFAENSPSASPLSPILLILLPTVLAVFLLGSRKRFL